MENRITACLWFDNQAEEAMNFYCSIFKNSKKGASMRYGDAGPGPKGSVMTAAFELNGQSFMALNGGPLFKFSEAVSFIVYCDDQKELDETWEKLSSGGKESRCGWLKDRFGVSWQVIPRAYMEMVNNGTPEQLERVMKALMPMGKLDIAKLQQAYNG